MPGQKNYILIKSIKTHWTSEAKALSYSESYEKSPESLAKSDIGSLLWRTLQRKDLQCQFISFLKVLCLTLFQFILRFNVVIILPFLFLPLTTPIPFLASFQIHDLFFVLISYYLLLVKTKQPDFKKGIAKD